MTTDWWTRGEHYKEAKAGNDIKMGCGYPDRLLMALEKGLISRGGDQDLREKDPGNDTETGLISFSDFYGNRTLAAMRPVSSAAAKGRNIFLWISVLW